MEQEEPVVLSDADWAAVPGADFAFPLQTAGWLTNGLILPVGLVGIGLATAWGGHRCLGVPLLLSAVGVIAYLLLHPYPTIISGPEAFAVVTQPGLALLTGGRLGWRRRAIYRWAEVTDTEFEARRVGERYQYWFTIFTDRGEAFGGQLLRGRDHAPLIAAVNARTPHLGHTWERDQGPERYRRVWRVGGGRG